MTSEKSLVSWVRAKKDHFPKSVETAAGKIGGVTGRVKHLDS
jgi:hypothetical protein